MTDYKHKYLKYKKKYLDLINEGGAKKTPDPKKASKPKKSSKAKKRSKKAKKRKKKGVDVEDDTNILAQEILSINYEKLANSKKELEEKEKNVKDLLKQIGGNNVLKKKINELIIAFNSFPKEENPCRESIINQIIQNFDNKGTVEVILCENYLSGNLVHPMIEELIKRVWTYDLIRPGKRKIKRVNRFAKLYELDEETDIDIICYLTILLYTENKIKEKLKTDFKEMQIQSILQSLNELRKSPLNSIVSFTEIPKSDEDINEILISDYEIQVFRYVDSGVAIAIKTTVECSKVEPTELLNLILDRKERKSISREARFFKVECGDNVYVPFHLAAGKSMYINDVMNILYGLIENNLERDQNIILIGDGNGHLNSTKSINHYIDIEDENLAKIQFMDYGGFTGHGAVHEKDTLRGIDVIGSNKIDLIDSPLTLIPYEPIGRITTLDTSLDIEGLSDHKRLFTKTKTGAKYIISSNLGYHKIFHTIMFRLAELPFTDRKEVLDIFYNYLKK